MKYRKKPVTIEAIRFVALTPLGDPLFDIAPNGGVVPDWLIEALSGPEEQEGTIWVQHAGADAKPSHLCIATLEGALIVTAGDWIVRGIKGELYPVKPDIFEATYEAERPSIEPEEGESAGDMLQRLGMDGKLWAEEFCRKFENHVIREKGHGVVDVALMIGWFANAIMAGYDRGRAQGWKEDAPHGHPRFQDHGEVMGR